MNAPPTPIRSFTLDNLLLFALGHLATLPSKQVEVASDLPGTTLYGVLFSQLTVDSQIDLRYAVCMSNKRYEFRIPVGDWSDDGHGKCDWFNANAAKPIEDVREAWFKASAEHPDLSPTSFCEAYEDAELPQEVRNKLSAAGCPAMLEDFDTESMAAVVVWFLNLGDPSLDVRLLTSEESIPMLPFYGFDSKGRHIEGVGYGLLGS